MGHSVWSWYCPDSVVLFLPGYTLAVMHRSGINYLQRAHPSLSFSVCRMGGLGGEGGHEGWEYTGPRAHSSAGDQSRVKSSRHRFGYVASSLSLALRLIQNCFNIHLYMHVSRTSGIRIHFLFFSYPFLTPSFLTLVSLVGPLSLEKPCYFVTCPLKQDFTDCP